MSLKNRFGMAFGFGEDSLKAGHALVKELREKETRLRASSEIHAARVRALEEQGKPWRALIPFAAGEFQKVRANSVQNELQFMKFMFKIAELEEGLIQRLLKKRR